MSNYLRRVLVAFTASASLGAVTSSARADDAAALAPTDSEDTRNDPTLATAGIVLTATGGAALTAGVVLALARPSLDCRLDGVCAEGPENVIGHIMMVGGGTLVLAGVPMIVVGSWGTSNDSTTTRTAAQLRAGPGRAELVGTF